MPTLQQLPQAVTVSVDDELLLAQDGSTCVVQVGLLLGGTQPALTLAPGALLGRVNYFPGGPEPVGVGGGLVIEAGSLCADATALAFLDSPSFTGTPTAPTPPNGDSSDALATTAFVQANLPSVTISGDLTGGGQLGTTGTEISVSLPAITAAGTYSSVTVNTKGLVLSGSTLAASDIDTALGYTPYDAANPANYVAAPSLDVFPVLAYGAYFDGTHDDQPGIAAAIAAANTAGGGTVLLPAGKGCLAATLVQPYNNIHLVGAGVAALSHNTTPTYDTGTVLHWIGAVGGTMARVGPAQNLVNGRSISNADVRGIVFDCSAVAGTGLIVASVNNSKFDVGYFQPTVCGLLVTTALLQAQTGPSAATYEINDSQHNVFRVQGYSNNAVATTIATACGGSATMPVVAGANLWQGLQVRVGSGLYIVQSVSGNTVTLATPLSSADGAVGSAVVAAPRGVWLQGLTTAAFPAGYGGPGGASYPQLWPGNVSLNQFESVTLIHYTHGDGFTFGYSDHNYVSMLTVYSLNGGNGVVFDGSPGLGQQSDQNQIYYCSTGSIVARGTTTYPNTSGGTLADSAYASSDGWIGCLDTHNGTSNPVIEPGAVLRWTTDTDVHYSGKFVTPIVYEAGWEPLTGTYTTGVNTSLTVVNNSSDHLRFCSGTGTYSWSVNIDGNQGNLRIYPAGGSIAAALQLGSPNSPVNVTGGMRVAGTTSLAGGLTVAGTTSLSGALTAASVAVAGTASVSGALVAGGGFTVSSGASRTLNLAVYDQGWEPLTGTFTPDSAASLFVVNNSSDHIRLATGLGTDGWAINIDGTQGNLRVYPTGAATASALLIGSGTSPVVVQGTMTVALGLTAPTVAPTDNSSNAATTAFVKTALGSYVTTSALAAAGYVTASAAAVAAPVQSVNGHVGAVILGTSDIPGLAGFASVSAPVQSVAGRAGAVVVGTSDIAGLASFAAASAPVQTVAGRTGAVTIGTADIAGLAGFASGSAPVQSVAGRTGAVVIGTADIAGLASYASAASPVQSVAGRTGAVTIGTSDVAGLASYIGVSAPVQSVAGRAGAVVIGTADIAGLASYASASAPVQSVAGRTGAVVIGSSDVAGLAAFVTATAPVQTVAGRTGAITIGTTDIAGLAGFASGSAPVQSVAGRTGAVVVGTADIAGLASFAGASAPVQSVAGRTGVVTIGTGDIAGLASFAGASAPVQSVAGRNGAVVVGTADLAGFASAAAAAAPVQSVAGRSGNVTLAAADVAGVLSSATAAATYAPVAAPALVGNVAMQVVGTLSALRAVGYAALANGVAVYVMAYATPGDGGAGVFVWSAASNAADNGGVTVNPNGNAGAGRWVRQLPDGRVTPQMFGAKGDGATNDTVAFAAALLAGPVVVPSATYRIANLAIPNGAWMEGGAGLGYSGDVGTTPGSGQNAAVVKPILLAVAGTSTCILNVYGCSDATIKGVFVDGGANSPTCDGVSSGSTQLMMERVTVVRCINGLGSVTNTDLYTHVATLINCEFANNTNGISNLIDTAMIGGAVSANTIGVNLGSGANANSFIAVRFEWSINDGVAGYNAASNVFCGGLFDRNAWRGINLGAGCNDWTFVGVQFARNGSANVYPNNSHVALNGTTSVFFNGCVSRTGANDDGTGTVSPAYFVNYINTNALVTISGCDVSGYLTGFSFGTNPTSYVQRDNDGGGDTFVTAARPYVGSGVVAQTLFTKAPATIAPGATTTISLGQSPITTNYSTTTRALHVTAVNNNSPYQSCAARIALGFYRDTAVHAPSGSAAYGETGGTGVITWGGSGKLQLSAASVATDGSSWTLGILNGGTGDGSNWSVFAELH